MYLNSRQEVGVKISECCGWVFWTHVVQARSNSVPQKLIMLELLAVEAYGGGLPLMCQLLFQRRP